MQAFTVSKMVNVSFAIDAINDLTTSLAHYSAQVVQCADFNDPILNNLPIIFLNQRFPML
jgi:hypothetical protein